VNLLPFSENEHPEKKGKKRHPEIGTSTLILILENGRQNLDMDLCFDEPEAIWASVLAWHFRI